MRVKKFYEGEFYHIYNRGNSRQKIFLDEEDYRRFLKLLYLANGENAFNFKEHITQAKINSYNFDRGGRLVDICAYVLMPNHYHIYIFVPFRKRQEQDATKVYRSPTSVDFKKEEPGAVVSKFMKKLNTSYAKYFNHKYGRTGGLFEGKFKAEHVADDEYFKYLFSYINLNPVKLFQHDWREIGIVDSRRVKEYLDAYEYSSYVDYFVDLERVEGKILNRGAFLSRIPVETDLLAKLLEWLSYNKFTDVRHR